MKLIEDLGMLYPTINSKYKKRYGLYQCIKCEKEFKLITNEVNRNNTKTCSCSKNSFSNHRLYIVWNNMMQRCYNKNSSSYHNYGKRGIVVCDEWHNVENFINDMFPSFIEGLSLDRENPNGNYYKDNCRWSTRNTQSQNTRKIISTNTSGYRGCCWHKNKKRWVAQISVNGKHISLGDFDNPIDGAKAYDNYVITNNLEHTLNFSYN